ncbi:MAG: calcium-binding protein [Pseudomonadota bacterium]
MTNIVEENLALTDAELSYLRGFLVAGDRGGFYMAYYNMTGSQQAIEQAQISTFSELYGGGAFLANALLQYYYYDHPTTTYDMGIYTLSQAVADSAFRTIEGSETGIISDEEMFQAAQLAWINAGVEPLFPGNLLEWDLLYDSTVSKVSFDWTLEEIAGLANNIFNEHGRFDVPLLVISLLKVNPGAAAALFSGLGPDIFGKQRSDYDGLAGYTITETPDSRYEVVTRDSDGKTVAVFDDQLFPDFTQLDTQLEALSGFFTPDIFEAFEFALRQFMTDIRLSLNEGDDFNGGDGLFLPPEVERPAPTDYPDNSWLPSQSGTDQKDTIFGTDGFGDTGVVGGDDLINAGSDNDFVVGGKGEDSLFGDAGDDIVLGQQQDDRLYGGSGQDVLRGGEGDDTLYGDTGADVLDGGDLRAEESGDDHLYGGAGADTLFGSDGNDLLVGGEDDDVLFGGIGDDQFLWRAGDGHDIVRDADSGNDRILIEQIAGQDPVDLSSLNFVRQSDDSNIYIDTNNPNITLRYDGGPLVIVIGSGDEQGTITLEKYAQGTESDFGIRLDPYTPPVVPTNGVTVSVLGTSDDPADDETDYSSYWRDLHSQRGINWSDQSISFIASNVINYTGGSLWGTVDGYFEGGPQGDYLEGDSGQNALNGLAGDDFISGLDDWDQLEGGTGSDTIQGGAGVDVILGDARQSQYDLWSNNPTSERSFYLPQMLDQSFDINVLAGDADTDLISGGRYTDIIDGGTEGDYLLGNTGKDTISGGDGDDYILGDSALDWDLFDNGDGTFTRSNLTYFADGSDVVGDYDDVIFGGKGRDLIAGEAGDDSLYGDEDNDVLIGDRDNQTLSGYFPTDVVPDLDSSLHGDDQLYGGSGADILFGLGGADSLTGGSGSDVLDGGSGDDIFFHGAGDGLDLLVDTEGNHTLVFQGASLGELNVIFQGNVVTVTSGDGNEGFQFSESEWANVSIALGSANNVIDRSRLNQFYYDALGNITLTVPGNDDASESERGNIFDIDDSDIDRPRIRFNDASQIEKVQLERIDGIIEVTIISSVAEFLLYVTEVAGLSPLEYLQLFDGLSMSLLGFDGIEGTNGNDSIVGTSGRDDLDGAGGSDVIEGLGGDDNLDGGSGRDFLYGGTGDDELFGGFSADDDYLEGGPGDDTLYGYFGGDTYFFSLGDGDDFIDDTFFWSNNIAFAADVDPDSIVLTYFDETGERFWIEYGDSDRIRTNAVFPDRLVGTVSVDGFAVPLRHRSMALNGSFFDTSATDIFETGNGNDVIYAEISFSENDIFLFAAGDQHDTIDVSNGIYKERMGEIQFSNSVDVTNLSFTFSNADAVINYGAGDQVTIDTDVLFSFNDNALLQFTLSSLADPDWIPTIHGSAWMFGTRGTDYLVGGNSTDIITPGYGSDLIEAGGGSDRIILNENYMPSEGGIGFKQILGGEGDDQISAPLHQGLTIGYDLGDGTDTLFYDWSYGFPNPYSIVRDSAERSLNFSLYGADEILFGEGISLANLNFVRTVNDLSILIDDGSGGIEIPNYFVGYGTGAAVTPSDIDEYLDTENPFYSLLDTAWLAALPEDPIQQIRFADDSFYDLRTTLDVFLEVNFAPSGAADVYGTHDDDTLVGEAGDTIIVTLEGDDTVEDLNGSNEVYTGRGQDSITLGSNSIVNAGAGDDYIELQGSGNTIQFGPGSGHDTVYFTAPDTSGNVLQFAHGITQDDISISTGTNELGDPALIVEILSSGDRLYLTGSEIDAETMLPSATAGNTIAVISFDDGTTADSDTLRAIASYDPTGNGELLFGTEEGDDITGGAGDDVISAGGGNDFIQDSGGSNTIYAGAGDDEIYIESDFNLIFAGEGDDFIDDYGFNNDIYAEGGDDFIYVEGDTIVRPGEGNDYVQLFSGGNTVHFGPGGGTDTVRIALSAAPSTSVELVDGITAADVQIYEQESPRGEPALAIHLTATGDTIFLTAYEEYFPSDEDEDADEIDPFTSLGEIRFSDGSVISNRALPAVFIDEDDDGDGDDDDVGDDDEVVSTVGTSGNDNLVGTEGDDILIGLEGNDILSGLGGNDTFIVEGTDQGRDRFNGGAGFDVLQGGDGDDTFTLSHFVVSDSVERIDGGLGTNTIAGGTSANTLDFSATELVNIQAIDGGAGNDAITGTDTADVIFGGTGNDVINGAGGDDTFIVEGSGQGRDRFNGGAGFDVLQGGDGDDTFTLSHFVVSDSVERIDGGLGTNTIAGGTSANTFDFSATELVNIQAIDGGTGNDAITGTDTADVIIGGAGNDVINGAGGDDTFIVEGTDQGRDRFNGGAGFDVLQGGDGDDTFTLSHFVVSDSVERIDGGLGTNTIAGGTSSNTLDFSATELVNIQAIDGGAGNDAITGTDTADVIIGGAGNDTLSGRGGSDIYHFALGDGRDVILNDDSDATSNDELKITGVDYDDLWMSRNGDDLVVDIVGSNDQVTIKDWFVSDDSQLDAIHAEDYILVRNQVDALVSAMAVYDVPEGVDAVIPQETRDGLDSVLTTTWQASV